MPEPKDAAELAEDATEALSATQAAAMEQALKLPQEITRFCAQRMSRDLDTMQALGRCRTPAEIMSVWSEAAQLAADDYRDEMFRVVEIVTNGAAKSARPKARATAAAVKKSATTSKAPRKRKS